MLLLNLILVYEHYSFVIKIAILSIEDLRFDIVQFEVC